MRARIRPWALINDCAAPGAFFMGAATIPGGFAMAQTEAPHVTTEAFVPMDKIVSLCKRRGFVYPNSEIYGGVAGLYDFGPLGVEMRQNLRQHWWTYMVQTRENVVGIEGAIITHPRVWEASGHVEN